MISSFGSHTHRFLSNFYSCEIEFDGHTYKSLEHAYQGHKALYPWDELQIREVPSAAEAKRLGKCVARRAGWDDIRIAVMTDLLKVKFTAGSQLAAQLLATGDHELMEGNYWHDNFWGACSCNKCAHIIGQNHLGKLLMQRREELRHE